MSKESEQTLQPKQERFCREYIIDLNGSQSAIRAGYSEKTAGSQSSRLLKNVKIQKRLQELGKDRNISTQTDANYVLTRLREIDELDVIDIVNDDLSGFKPISEWPKVWRISISAMDMKKMITTIGDEATLETVVEKIKWPDKARNLELLGKHVFVGAFGGEIPSDEDPQPLTITFGVKEPVGEIKITRGE